MRTDPELTTVLLDNMSESVLITDDEPNLPGPRIVYANPAFERETGYSIDELIGRTPRILQGPKTDRSILKRLKSCIESDRLFTGALVNYRKDGGEFINSFTVMSVNLRDARYLISIQHDITVERRFAALASATATFENAAYMIAGIRHELGNPVNSMKAALTLLRDQVHSLPTDKVDYYIAALLREISRIERLLTGLRTMNAFEQPRPSNTPLAASIALVRAFAEPLLSQHNLEWREDVPDDAIAFVDPQSLHQILLNIVRNSIEAMAARSSGFISLSFDVAGGRLIVMDNGPGMNSMQVQNLFQPFFTTKNGGSGLGLYVARRLAVEMGGDLTLETQLGGGTSVTVLLPLARRSRSMLPPVLG